MAFVVRNSSDFVGSAKLEDGWRNLSPGDTITVSVKPVSITHNITVFEVNDSTKASIEKSINSKKSKKKEVSDTIIDSDSSGNSNSAEISFNEG